MKELRKRFLALVMGAVMIFGVGAFAGCNGGNKEQTPQTPSTGTTTPDKNNDKDTDKDNNKDTDKDTDKDNDAPSVTPDADKDQDGPAQTPAKTKAEAISAFNAAVQKIDADKNFTYTEIGAEYVAEFEGAKLKVTENGTSVFYATEGDQNYSYILRDSVWHKDFSETTAAGIFSALTAVFGDVIWSDFEAEENLLTGTASGETVEATVTETMLTVETAQKKFTLTKLGTTAVSLPADAVDDTDASNFIFTTDENGETVWNRKLIAETLKKWWPEGYCQKIMRKDCELIDILAIEYEEGSLTFLAYFNGDSGKFFHKIGIPKAYFNAEELQTVSGFEKYLNSREYPIDSINLSTQVEYSTLDEDYETAHKQEFETLTKNGFERLATVGVQGDGIMNEGEIVKDFEGSKILFGFKIPNTITALSPDMGYTQNFWTYYVLQKDDGNIEFVNLMFVSKAEDPIGNVLQDKNNTWRIHKIERKDIAKENLVLFDAPTMTIDNIA